MSVDPWVWGNAIQVTPWLIGWMFDWLVHWLIDLLIVSLLEWLVDCLIAWLIDWLVVWLINWLVDWLLYWLVDWLVGWLVENLLACLIACLIDWLLAWLVVWLIDCLFDWLIDWLLDWLIDCFIDGLIDWLIDWFIDVCYTSGWTSRQQFEETWAALLGVLSSPPNPDTVSPEVRNQSPSLRSWRSQSMRWTVFTGAIFYWWQMGDWGLVTTRNHSPICHQYKMVPMNPVHRIDWDRQLRRLSIPSCHQACHTFSTSDRTSGSLLWLLIVFYSMKRRGR